MPFRTPKWLNLAEKRWFYRGVLPIDQFPIEKLHKFASNRILAQKKNNHRNEYFQKTSCFAGRNDGIWPKNDEPLTGSYLLTHFKSKSWTNLSETEFWHKKKRAPKRKFLKNAITETATIEFGRKMMILQGSPSHWPISNRKVALICLKLNSGAKKKKSTETKIFQKMQFRRLKR